MLDGNWKAHRFGRSHRIEILADECYLPVGYAEKNHIILSINAPGRFDDPLRLYLADCTRRILEWVNSEIEEAEAVNRASKPRNVAHDFVSPG